MTTSTYNPCLLISKESTTGFGIVGMQIDETLALSDQQFATKEAKELRFLAKKRQKLVKDSQIDFNSCTVTTDGTIINLR